jgi:hypothetical protein
VRALGNSPHMKIVKVQQSLSSSLPGRRMLIYDQSRRVYQETELSPKVEHLLAGRARAFFFYSLDAHNEIILGREAPAQDW